VQRQLADRGVDALWFKGLALLPHYGTMSARSMSDADLLVRPRHRHRALDVLDELGFAPNDLPRRTVERYLSDTVRTPGTEFVDRNGIRIDLHFRPLHMLTCDPAVDDLLFEHSTVERVLGGEVRTPHPSHHVVLAVGHGDRAHSGARLLSVVDAAHLLGDERSTPALGVDLARRYGRVSSLGACLATLADLLTDHDQEFAITAKHTAEWRAAIGRPQFGDRIGRSVRNLDSSGRAADAVAGAHAVLGVARQATWRDGGAPAALVEASRRHWLVPRSRDVVPHAIWVAGGRRTSWNRWRRDRPPLDSRPALRPGDALPLIGDDAEVRCLGAGWAIPSNDATWTVGRHATLHLSISLAHEAEVEIGLDVTAYHDAVVDRQEVHVLWDDAPVDRWVFERDRSMPNLRWLPPRPLPAGLTAVDLRLRIDRPMRPCDTSPNRDVRALGVSVSRLVVRSLGD
jgi:hypothetical protein